MNSFRTALSSSFLFHAALAAALAWPSLRTVDQRIRAGRDSVQSITLAAASTAEPRVIDSPVVATPQEADSSTHERRFVETPATPVAAPAARVPEPPRRRVVDEAPSKAAAMRLPERAAVPRRHVPPATAAEVSEAPAPRPVRRSLRRPSPSISVAATAARATKLGAAVQPASEVRIVPPVFTDAPPPVFPAEAQRRGWRGIVLLRITVDERGVVTQVQVDDSSGYAALDAAAVRAVRTWRGRPATRDGDPYLSTWRKPIRFQ